MKKNKLSELGIKKESGRVQKNQGTETEEAYCAVYNSFISCISLPLYLYGCPMLPQIHSLNKEKEQEEDALSRENK